MSDNQDSGPETLHSIEIELSEEQAEFFEKEIQKDLKNVPDGDSFGCYVRALLDKKIIETSDPSYVFFQNTERLYKILQLIPQIRDIKIGKNRIFIEPTAKIIHTKDKIKKINDLTFLERSRFRFNEDREFNERDLAVELKLFIFLKVVTNIEVYLEDKLKNTLRSNESVLDNFIKNLENDMPTKWRNGTKISPYDYYRSMRNIIFDYILLFPYHEISRRTNHFYRKAFNLDLMTYSKKDKLIKMINRRHKLIHRGYENLLLEEDELFINNIEDCIKLSYDFICWIEDNLSEYNIDISSYKED